MPYVAEINGASIVLTGSFNPTIFQPEWFLRQELLGTKEVEEAKINVLVPQICAFETERFQCQVTTDRFAVASKAAANPTPLRDLVLGTFFILEHTPLTALGLNRQMHFPLQTEQHWHHVGDKLVPKDAWNNILPGRPGMRSLSILSPLADTEGTVITVKVEPSTQIKYGIYFETNEHYPAPKSDVNKYLMTTLKERWEKAYNYAAEIAEHILSWTRE